MKGLDTLIRMHKWQLDEKRRGVVALEQFADKLRRERQKLLLDFEDEKQAASRAPEAAFTFEAYARSVKDRLARLERSLDKILDELEAARAALSEAFQEVKRYEIAQSNRDRKQREAERRAEREAIDEIGLNQFRRKSA